MTLIYNTVLLAPSCHAILERLRDQSEELQIQRRRQVCSVTVIGLKTTLKKNQKIVKTEHDLVTCVFPRLGSDYVCLARALQLDHCVLCVS